MGKVFRVKTSDATGTPIVSGGSSANANSILLVTPAGYSQLRVSCAGAYKWGDNALLDGNAAGGFVVELANAVVDIPVAGTKSVTLKTVGGAAQFYFSYRDESGD